MKHAMWVGILATITPMMSTFAATSTCPSVQSIEQIPSANGGFIYRTPASDGLLWSGENPLASASYLNDSTFHDARYDAINQAVICTYKGPMNNDASFSVTLTPVSSWNLIPIGDWRGTYCEALEITKCSFTHQ